MINKAKMKKVIAFIFLAFSFVNTNAQYPPFINEGSTWHTLVYGWGVQEYYHHINGDSLINNQTYKKLNVRQSINGPDFFTSLIRENTDEQRVYVYYGLTESLLYDFSLQVGDTVTVSALGYPTLITITSVESVMVNGMPRKKLNFEDGWNSAYWIEGMGSNYGPMDAAIGSVADYSPTLTCYYQGNDLAWSNPLNVEACSAELAIGELAVVQMEVMPNPFYNEVSIQTTGVATDRNFEIRLCDAEGRLIHSEKRIFLDRTKLNLVDLAPGLYVLTLSLNGEVQASKSLIKKE